MADCHEDHVTPVSTVSIAADEDEMVVVKSKEGEPYGTVDGSKKRKRKGQTDDYLRFVKETMNEYKRL